MMWPISCRNCSREKRAAFFFCSSGEKTAAPELFDGPERGNLALFVKKERRVILHDSLRCVARSERDDGTIRRLRLDRNAPNPRLREKTAPTLRRRGRATPHRPGATTNSTFGVAIIRSFGSSSPAPATAVRSTGQTPEPQAAAAYSRSTVRPAEGSSVHAYARPRKIRKVDY